jgi:hypothetical protein
MKKVGVGILGTCLFLLASGFFLRLPGATMEARSEIIRNELFTIDTLTIYNPSPRQCDSDPLVTASNKRINMNELRKGTIRWMALSRNMLKRWGGQLHYGDTVMLHSGDAGIDGIWIIQDTMNKRFKNRGDLLFDAASRSNGMWTNVKIVKRKIYYVMAQQ